MTLTLTLTPLFLLVSAFIVFCLCVVVYAFIQYKTADDRLDALMRLELARMERKN